MTEQQRDANQSGIAITGPMLGIEILATHTKISARFPIGFAPETEPSKHG